MPVGMEDRPTGTLLVKGDVQALHEHLAAAGVDNTAVVGGGVLVSRAQAGRARKALGVSAPAPLAVKMSERSNGMLDVRGAEAAAVRSRLEMAGIDPRAIRDMGDGVTVSEAHAQRVREVLGVPAAAVPAVAGAAAGVQAGGVKGDPAGISEDASGEGRALDDQPAAGAGPQARVTDKQPRAVPTLAALVPVYAFFSWAP